MSDHVSCGQCGTRYDSDENAFCPRCGSTRHSDPVPGALPVAARHDPGRRRVQASGVLLIIVGSLFLVSSLVGLAIPVQELARQFVEPMADQPGGVLLLVPGDDAPYAATVSTLAGEVLVNESAQVGDLRVASPKHASLKVLWTAGNVSGNVTAIVISGDTLRLPLNVAPAQDTVIGATLAKTVSVGRIVFIVAATVLVAGGASGLLLRAWPLAAVAALMGVILGLVVVAAFLWAGLLFAIPFGLAASFILRGRRYFKRNKTDA